MNSSVMLSAPTTKQSPSSMILGELDRSMKYYGAMADLLGGRLRWCMRCGFSTWFDSACPTPRVCTCVCMRANASRRVLQQNKCKVPSTSMANSPAFEAHGLKRRVRKLVDCTVEVPQAADSRVLSPKSNGVQYDEYRDEIVEYYVGLEAPAHATDTMVVGLGSWGP